MANTKSRFPDKDGSESLANKNAQLYSSDFRKTRNRPSTETLEPRMFPARWGVASRVISTHPNT